MLQYVGSRYFFKGADLFHKFLDKEGKRLSRSTDKRFFSLSSIALLIGATALTDAKGSEVQENNRWNIVPLDTQIRSFFKYEKRIREMSTREKVFEYFASLKSQGTHSVMSPSDVMRSLVPVYPRITGENSQATSATRQRLDVVKESSLLSSQEYFSFHEWLLIEALLSVPEDEINVAFAMLDSDENGEIDKNEFLELITSFLAKEREMPASDDIFCSRLVKFLFGEDLRQNLTLQSLELFVKRLRSDIIHLEFEHYDVDKKGQITGECLARSIACHAQIEKVDDLFRRVSGMQDTLKHVNIGYAQYEEYIRVIRSMKSILVGIEFYKKNFGRLDLDGFKKVLDRLNCSCSFPLSEIIFYLFSDNGELNARELGNAMMMHVGSIRSLTCTQNGMVECLRTCFVRHRG